MPVISYDRQSFSIDGRRIWLVSGAIHYPRVPHELWRQRIRAAKQAGLNCIETYVFWNIHEPTRGKFDFKHNADLRRFVELIGEEGMYCILRPGPYVCAEWDFGGHPAWLNTVEGLRYREANEPYLEACSRYLGQVMEQVRDLQVTAPTGGPIVMMQAENEWLCHHPEQGRTYLREIVRYLRENGCAVPINVCNNLWQRVEGAIDTWNANEHLAGDLRQLAIVQPNAPRIVTEFWPGWFDAWGRPHHTKFDAQWNLARLAQMLAVGAQYNLYMFHGGTNFAFHGGRSICGPDCFMTTSYDYDAPLREAGGRGEKYAAVKRISTFASQFGHVFAHLDARQHAAAAPTGDAHGLSVIHQSGGQGDVVFIIRHESDQRDSVDVLLPNGLTMPVPLDDQRAAWLVTNANLGGVAELTWTNLRPWAFVGKSLLVLFGPAGAEGLVNINGATTSVTVPTGKTPTVIEHEDIHIAVLNIEQVDAACITPTGIVIGAGGLDDDNAPLPLAGWATQHTVSHAGEVASKRITTPKKPTAPKLTDWQAADVSTLLDGTSDAYKPIEGPTSLEALNADSGYGWYRISLKGTSRGKLLAPEMGDRLALFREGRLEHVLGLGEGAKDEPITASLSGDIVALVCNMGRYNFGWTHGERKGLFGDLATVRSIRLPKAKVISGLSPDLLAFRPFLHGVRDGERVTADALTWTIKPAVRKPVVLDIQQLPWRALISVNDTPVGVYDPQQSSGVARYVLRIGEQITGGKNAITLALCQPYQGKGDLSRYIKLHQVTDIITDKAEWAFAPWSRPEAGQNAASNASSSTDTFRALPKQLPALPRWYHGRFEVRDTAVPLFVDLKGMSKGQLYINGHNAGRYWVSTATGKAVGPQTRYYLPEPWLHTDKPNELLLFDEHGKRPTQCRLVYDPMGPYGGK